LQKLKGEEIAKRELIQREKENLIREHEDLLKSFFSKGYYKTVGPMASLPDTKNNNTNSSNNFNYSRSFSASSNPFK
jgi:hypothetical protein